jgi:hypothetical protein
MKRFMVDIYNVDTPYTFGVKVNGMIKLIDGDIVKGLKRNEK